MLYRYTHNKQITCFVSRPSRLPTSQSPQFTGNGAEPQGRTGTAGKRLPARGGAPLSLCRGCGGAGPRASLSMGGGGPAGPRCASLSVVGGVVCGAGPHTNLSLCTGAGARPSAGPRAPLSLCELEVLDHPRLSVVGGAVLGHCAPLSLCRGGGAGQSAGPQVPLQGTGVDSEPWTQFCSPFVLGSF